MVTDEIIIYKSEDGAIKLDVLFSEETVWLTQAQMSELFQRDRTVITKHISNVFEDGELTEEGNVHFLHIANSDKPVKYYNLDVVISVGYRVKSPQGTQFRIWATQRLRDYIIKGFALNDERFKSGSSMNYFRELLERIREIRTEERVFYQQIKEIYKTSWDYDPEAQITLDFFAEIQNKLLWAVSGKTAAELRYYRANHTLPMMGLTSTSKAGVVRKSDITVGKNYLDKEELQALKLIVEQYLAFAESQALAHNKMSMRDWIDKLKLILTMNNRNILEHSGRISKELADKKVTEEYNAYKEEQRRIRQLESIKELDKDLKRLKIGKK
jgi:toxin-antitoxin system, toxin component, fic family